MQWIKYKTGTNTIKDEEWSYEEVFVNKNEFGSEDDFLYECKEELKDILNSKGICFNSWRLELELVDLPPKEAIQKKIDSLLNQIDSIKEEIKRLDSLFDKVESIIKEYK